MHVIERTDKFTIVGSDARRGKLTLFAAEGPRQPGALSRIVFCASGTSRRSSGPSRRPRGCPPASRPRRGSRDRRSWVSGWIEAGGGRRLRPRPRRTGRARPGRRAFSELAELGFVAEGNGRLRVGGAHLRGWRKARSDDGGRPLLNHLGLSRRVDHRPHRAEARAARDSRSPTSSTPPTHMPCSCGAPSTIKLEYVEHKGSFSLEWLNPDVIVAGAGMGRPGCGCRGGGRPGAKVGRAREGRPRRRLDAALERSRLALQELRAVFAPSARWQRFAGRGIRRPGRRARSLRTSARRSSNQPPGTLTRWGFASTRAGLTSTLVARAGEIRLGDPLEITPRRGCRSSSATGGFQGNTRARAPITSRPRAITVVLRANRWSTGGRAHAWPRSRRSSRGMGWTSSTAGNLPAPPARVPEIRVRIARTALRPPRQGRELERRALPGPGPGRRSTSFSGLARRPGARALATWSRRSALGERDAVRHASPSRSRAPRRPAPTVRRAGTGHGLACTSRRPSRPRSAGLRDRTRAARAADGVWAAGADAGGIATGGYASGLAAALVTRADRRASRRSAWPDRGARASDSGDAVPDRHRGGAVPRSTSDARAGRTVAEEVLARLDLPERGHAGHEAVRRRARAALAASAHRRRGGRGAARTGRARGGARAGATPMGAGLHPDRELGRRARYVDSDALPRASATSCAACLRRTPECALHVHVGDARPGDRDARVSTACALTCRCSPALAANSPLWFGTDSGLASARCCAACAPIPAAACRAPSATSTTTSARSRRAARGRRWTTTR